MLDQIMMNQEIADMEFNTYFNVTSNTMQSSHQHQKQQQQPQQQQQQQQHQQQQKQKQQQQQMMYDQRHLMQQNEIHPTQQINMSQFNPQQYYISKPLKQQSPTEMLNWSFNQQNTPNLHMQNSNNTVSTHGNNSFTSNQTSPRPDYFYTTGGQPNSAGTTPSELFPQSDMSPQQLQHYSNPTSNDKELSFEYNSNSSMDLDYRLANLTTTSPVNKKIGLVTTTSNNITPRSPHSPPLNSPSSTSSENNNTLLDSLQYAENKAKRNSTNRKESDTLGDIDRAGSIYDNSSSMMEAATVLASVGAGRQFKKVAHNAIERRYRKNINERILDLKNVVPALYKAKIGDNKSSGNDESSDDEYNGLEKRNSTTEEIVEGVPVAKKLNKATILHKATEYIHHLKHSNQVAENENQALLHIMSQMPGGARVLEQFQAQKRETERLEQQRLLAQRKQSIEQEKIEHQRMLRERAAHRAALAELIPKPERKPYPRRAKKKQQTTKSTGSPNSKSSVLKDRSSPKNGIRNDLFSQNNNANKTFMVMFLCLAIASPLTFGSPPTHKIRANPNLQTRSIVLSDDSFLWHWAKIGLFVAFFMVSLSYYILRPYKRIVGQKKF